MNSITVSIVMATYNRAHTIGRAIDSVIAQDYSNWELIIVDDGSTDNTKEFLSRYNDSRISLVCHDVNKGVCAAKNTGFNSMVGVWFTTLDSDDEMVPNALSTLLQVLIDIDPSIDAINCNCLDTVTGLFSGKGIDNDQWLEFEFMVKNCTGEHWGLTKRSLLGNLRFNEMINGGEALLWYRIGQNSKRYYIHKALRIYHTEGEDRICSTAKPLSIDKFCTYYREISNDSDYLNILRKYNFQNFSKSIFNIILVEIIDGNLGAARRVYCDTNYLHHGVRKVLLYISFRIGSLLTKRLLIFLLKIRYLMAGLIPLK